MSAIPSIIAIPFNALTPLSAEPFTSDEESSWIPTGVNEPLAWSSTVMLFEDGCPMAAPEPIDEEPSMQTDPFWLSRPQRRICVLCDGNCECEVDQTPPLHKCGECDAYYTCNLWDPKHGCCADCDNFPECAVCVHNDLYTPYGTAEHACVDCNQSFECPEFEHTSGCYCLPINAQCSPCEGKEMMACWAHGTLTMTTPTSIPTKVDPDVCTFCGTVWKDWKFILNPNYCECEMRKDMFAEIEASWEPTVPTANETCNCLFGEECNSCAPRMSFPCLSCNIPIFCGAPMICSDCV